MEMFWIDAQEDCSAPGRIFLFGKVRNGEGFSSCCVRIENVQRQVFVVPRERLLDGVGAETEERVNVMAHVFAEFGHAARGQGILAHKCRVVRRTCLHDFLEGDAPEEGEYLKCVYPAQYAGFPGNVGGRSFKRVLGGSQSLLEGFLLKRGLMGPCWVRVEGAEAIDASEQLSWCKLEFQASDPKCVQVAKQAREAPPVSIMSVSVRRNKERGEEVAMVSVLCHDSVNVDGRTENTEAGYSGFTGACKAEADEWPSELRVAVEGWNEENQKRPRSMHASERALLSWFAAKVQAVDADVLVGHGCVAGDLDVLLSRMHALKIDGSKLGRVRARRKGGRFRTTPGRLVCDTQVAAREHLKLTTYTLSELSWTQLGEQREDEPAGTGAMSVMGLGERDTQLIVSLMLKLGVLALSKQISNLAGNLWSRSLIGGRGERVEYLLLHEFHRLKYIVPEKRGKRARGEDEGEKRLSGGLVLEPRRGLHCEPVLVLDYKSLYPSVIQEFNICFTTVRRSDGGYELPAKGSKPGVLPLVMKTLVERRRQVQALMQQASGERKWQYEIRQTALKVMANSTYGCLGCRQSRFYAEALAELVTSQGRMVLQRAVEVVERKCQLQVLYGDTDSIFVGSGRANVADARAVARGVQNTLNRTWSVLEVGLECVYCPLLLVNKKKYAGMAVSEREGVVSTVKVVKGLDCVRRDCCGLAKRTADKVLDVVLSGGSLEKVYELLRALREDVEHDRLPLSDFVITKCMGRSPGDYADGDAQAHVQVALKQIAAGGVVRAGEHVAYVMTVMEGAKKSTQRAEAVSTVAAGGIAVDKKWYLQAQVHAAVSRILWSVEDTDGAQLAECLGVKAGCMRKCVHAEFADVVRFWGTCSDGACREFLGAYVVEGGGVRSGLRVCSATMRATDGVFFEPRAMRLQLQALFRKSLQRYTEGWLVCGEELCRHRTRNVACMQNGLRCTVDGCAGELQVEYTSRQLYEQLVYLEQLFDFGAAWRKLCAANAGRVKRRLLPLRAPKMADDDRAAIDVLHGDCQRMLAQSAYGHVDLARLFSGVR